MIHLRLLQEVKIGKSPFAAGSIMTLAATGKALADQLIAEGKAEPYRPPNRLIKQMQDALRNASCCGS